PTKPDRDKVSEHHTYHQSVIRTPQRDALRQHLTKSEIGSEIYYPVGLHLQNCFSDLGYAAGHLPETARATAETLALPIYPEISREAQSYVVDVIAQFFTAQRAGRR